MKIKIFQENPLLWIIFSSFWWIPISFRLFLNIFLFGWLFLLFLNIIFIFGLFFLLVIVPRILSLIFWLIFPLLLLWLYFWFSFRDNHLLLFLFDLFLLLQQCFGIFLLFLTLFLFLLNKLLCRFSVIYLNFTFNSFMLSFIHIKFITQIVGEILKGHLILEPGYLRFLSLLNNIYINSSLR